MIASTGIQLNDSELAALGERGFFVRDGVLGEDAARALHAELAALAVSGALRPAGVSRGAGYRRDAETRGDAIAWLEPAGPPDALEPLRGYLRGLRESLNHDAYLGLDRFEVQLAYYPGDGARYRRHRDAAPGRGSRRVTAIYYLNPDWRPEAGGLLRLHVPDGPVDVEPTLGRLVVFLSERVEHEVLPVAAPRLAVTAWFHGRG